MRTSQVMLAGCIGFLTAFSVLSGEQTLEHAAFSRLWTGAMLSKQKDWEYVPGGAETWPGLSTAVPAGGPEAGQTREYRVPLSSPLPSGKYTVFVNTAILKTTGPKCWAGVKLDDGKPRALAEFSGSGWVQIGDVETGAQQKTLVLLFRATEPPKLLEEQDIAALLENDGKKDDISKQFESTEMVPEQMIALYGVYVTASPKEMVSGAGEITESRPIFAGSAAERPTGNFLENSSFEAGYTHGWGAQFQAQGPALWWLRIWDETVGYDGGCSLRVVIPGNEAVIGSKGRVGYRTVESKMYALPVDRKYALSVWAKADKTLRLSIALRSHPDLEQVDGQGTTWLQAEETIGTDWKRVCATGKVGKSPGGYNYVSITADAGQTGGTAWLDAVQLEEGTEATLYRPREAVEAGTMIDVPGHILFKDESSAVKLAAYTQSKQDSPVVIESRLVDYQNREVWKQETTMDMAGRDRKVVPLAVPTGTSGIFRLLNSVKGNKGSPDEQILAVMPRPRFLDRFNPKGTLGIDTHVNREVAALLKRANFNYVLSKSYGRWHVVEPEKGRYNFFGDEAVKTAHEAGIGVVIQTLAVQWGGPEWIRPHAKPSTGKAKDNSGPWPAEDRDLYCKAYGDYVYHLVDHYKPWVKYWEIDNEPGYQVTSDEYLEIIKSAYGAAKRADPECTVIGGSHFYVGWMEGWLSQGGTNYCDEVSGHYYSSVEQHHERWAKRIVDKYAKRAWNSETGPTPPTWYLTLPEGVTAHMSLESRAETLRRGGQQSLDGVVKNYLTSLSFGKFKHYLYYFARFSNLSPNQPTRRGGKGKELFEYDGSPRMAGAGLCMASHFLDGAELRARRKGSPYLRCFVYAQESGSVGFAWCTEEAPLVFRLPGKAAAGIQWFDVMGAPLPVEIGAEMAIGRITKLPCYFTSGLGPDELLKVLDNMKLSLPVEMVAQLRSRGPGEQVLRIHLRNGLDEAAAIHGALFGNIVGHCLESPAIATRILSPGEMETIDLPVSLRLPAGLTDFPFSVGLSFNPGKERYTITDGFFLTHAVESTPLLDGDVADFKAPRCYVPGYRLRGPYGKRIGKVRDGAGNIFGDDWIRGEAAVAYDKEHLYLAADVVDAVVRMVAVDQEEIHGDRVVFLLKTDLDREPLSRQLTSDCFKVMLQLVAGGKIRATLRKADGSVVELPKAAASVREKGYTVEVAVPWSELGLPGMPGPGTDWGFQCEIFNAASVGGGTDSELVWSGTGLTCDDPTDWGQLRFEGRL